MYMQPWLRASRSFKSKLHYAHLASQVLARPPNIRRHAHVGAGKFGNPTAFQPRHVTPPGIRVVILKMVPIFVHPEQARLVLQVSVHSIQSLALPALVRTVA